MVPENALTPRFREPFAPFRAPAESGHEIMIKFSFTYRFIDIMVFRPFANLTPPFRGLSPLQQNIHIHICRCHSDTKSLAWVLGRLPYIFICYCTFHSPPDIANFRVGIPATPANAFSLGLLSGDSALLRALPMVVHPPLPVTLLELAHPSAMEQNET